MATVSDKPWGDFSDADYTIEQLKRASLIDLSASGVTPTKEDLRLPVREPDGTLNRNGVHAAAGGHGIQALKGVPAATVKAAAKKLVSLYGEIGDKAPFALLTLAGTVRKNADELETVDLDGVEILSAGGPVHGKGSPPEGDYWRPEDLRAMADADAELHGELNPAVSVNPPANKVGHVEQPAVGYLENLRVDKTGNRLLADVKKVPKKLGELIRSGAYRARSVELSKVTSQETGKTYEWVVTGLAWLGARLPAVRTLDDVVALYEGAGAVDVRLVAEYGADGGEPATARDEMLVELRNEIRAEVRVALADAAPGIFKTAADTRPKMADLVLTDEVQHSLAETLGVEGDISAESLLAAAKVKAETPAPPTGDLADVRAMAETATQKADAAEKHLAETERRHFIETALSEGRFEPGQREHFERQFDADEKSTRAYVATLPKNDDLAREYGSDEETVEETEETRKLEDAQSKRVISSLTGVPLEEVI